MVNTQSSSLEKLMKRLKAKIPEGERVSYAIPELWNCFDYGGNEKQSQKEGVICVNPYKFYYHCISDYIMTQRNNDLDYSQSLSLITSNHKDNINYLGGDWIKQSVIYAMHVRTTTSWDHNNSGFLEDISRDGFKETGTFMKSIAILPLLKKMGINTVYLLPISKYSVNNKKGELGSPYAVKNFFKLDSHLKDTMPGEDFSVDEEFRAFVEACHILNIRVMIDIIPRTAARDNELILKHPEWFYWIKKNHETEYFPPSVEGIEPAEKPSCANVSLIYKSPEVWEHISKFCEPPNILDEKRWSEFIEVYGEKTDYDLLGEIEKEFGITTAPAFSDCINDPQPPWNDVTFLKLYLDEPEVSKKFTEGHKFSSYILFDTIKCNIFKGEIINEELWQLLSDIIPFYQVNFGIDGARIDMGHALPEELVKLILKKPRQRDKDFSFIAEELLLDGAEKARNLGYNMIIGYGWWLEPRIFEFKTHEFMYGSREFKAPVFACAETPDTPRIAARDGGRILSKFVTIFNEFVPNSVPFLTSGLEIYETQPLNTGLDCRDDEKFRLSLEDPYIGKLAFFDKYQLHWDNSFRWDIPDTLDKVSKIREQFLSTITNPDNFVPVHFDHPRITAIGIAYIIENKRWHQQDNILMVIGNSDIYNEGHYKIHLDNIRRASGNASTRAWLLFSANESSHDIYDFDENWNLHLSFKPGEVKILIM